MIKNAVIIAPDDKGLEKVFGIPNVRRLVLLLPKVGIDNIVLLSQAKSPIPVLSDLLPPASFQVLDNPATLADAIQKYLPLCRERILLLRANTVIDKLTLAQFLEADQGAPLFRLPFAQDTDANGIYLADAANLVEAIKVLWSPQHSSHMDIGQEATYRGPFGLPEMVGEKAGDTAFCEEKLIAALAAQTAKTDGFMSRHLDRKISQFFSRRLVRTKMTPNQVTLSGMSIGLLGAVLLSYPGYWQRVLGSLLFVFCIIVDGVDGEVARLKVMDSRFGRYLDITTDNLVHIAVFVGIAVGLYRETGSTLYLAALWLLLGGFACCAAAVYKCILCAAPEVLKRSPKLLKLMKMLSNRDFAYLVALLAIVDHLDWFLIGAALGTYIFAASMWLLSGRTQQSCSSSLQS